MILRGPRAIAAVAQEVRRDVTLADLIPHPSLSPPSDAIDIYVSNSIAAPASTVQTVALAFQVRIGHAFALTAVTYRFDPETLYVPGDGAITWTLDVNRPITPSTLAIAGRTVQGFEADNAPIGSFERPWPLVRPRIFQAGDLIQLKVLTTVALAQNSGNFTSRFVGYLWPTWGTGSA
jgi:hypothetical protein